MGANSFTEREEGVIQLFSGVKSSTIESRTRLDILLFLAHAGGFQDSPLRSLRGQYFDFTENQFAPEAVGLTSVIESLEDKDIIDMKRRKTDDSVRYDYVFTEKGSETLLNTDLPEHDRKVFKGSGILYGSTALLKLMQSIADEFPQSIESRRIDLARL